MGVTNYYGVEGVIHGEQAVGSSRRDYVPDALGSVNGTVVPSAPTVFENRYEYKPYGALFAKTGTAPDPAFTWVGTLGYRQTGNRNSDVYVRARHYATVQGRWTTKDPIGIEDGLNLWRYVRNNPVTISDYDGLQALAEPSWIEILKARCSGFEFPRIPPVPCNPIVIQIGGATVLACGVVLACPSKCGNQDLQKCKDVCPYPKCVHPYDPGMKRWQYDNMGQAIKHFDRGGELRCEGRASKLKPLLPCKEYGEHQNVYCRRKDKPQQKPVFKGSAFCCNTCIDTPGGPVRGKRCGTN